MSFIECYFVDLNYSSLIFKDHKSILLIIIILIIGYHWNGSSQVISEEVNTLTLDSILSSYHSLIAFMNLTSIVFGKDWFNSLTNLSLSSSI